MVLGDWFLVVGFGSWSLQKPCTEMVLATVSRMQNFCENLNLGIITVLIVRFVIEIIGIVQGLVMISFLQAGD